VIISCESCLSLMEPQAHDNHGQRQRRYEFQQGKPSISPQLE